MKKKPKKCKTSGFVTSCGVCGQTFVAVAHVVPRCGGGFGDHKDHHHDDCCGVGNHKELREGLVCSDCIFQKNIRTLS